MTDTLLFLHRTTEPVPEPGEEPPTSATEPVPVSVHGAQRMMKLSARDLEPSGTSQISVTEQLVHNQNITQWITGK